MICNFIDILFQCLQIVFTYLYIIYLLYISPKQSN